MKKFRLVTEMIPAGDQPKAIDALVAGLQTGKRSQVLLGVTGSGKTFTIANVINQVQKPTLVVVHNKTLAAQLYDEFCEFFPDNAVEYFVSYYDYYQPEAYVARTDTYIEKSLSVNDQVEQLRLRATKSLLERKDVIVVASVSCIYGLGVPQYFLEMRKTLYVGQSVDREQILSWFIQLRYERKEALSRGAFRVKGDVVDIVPAYEQEIAIRIKLFGPEIEGLFFINPVSGALIEKITEVVIYPASHYVATADVRDEAIHAIRRELEIVEKNFLEQGMHAQADRIRQKTCFDIEMILQLGYCKGIENYSSHFESRAIGTPPCCLLDYFPEDYLMIVEESHQSIPQIRAMYQGDRSRKETLISFGFRLPSAFDNRPLKFDEFYNKLKQVIYVSATPADWEIREAGSCVEQVIRPTGLLDPVIDVRPATHQVDDVIVEVRKEIEASRRTLITTTTKKLAEELSAYFRSIGIKAEYVHADVGTMDRVQLLNNLRQGTCDVLIGINLLREGLDLPEVGLVAVLDADKEGFLRSASALIQVSGRAARNKNGRVIMYADKMTSALEKILAESARRRTLQAAHNEQYSVDPTTTFRKSGKLSSMFQGALSSRDAPLQKESVANLREAKKWIRFYKKAMDKASAQQKFEEAARYRNLLQFYQKLEKEFLDS